jgi:AcrR family transcriptional regulator
MTKSLPPAPTPRNRRLDPDVRRNLILDHTARLITAEGVSAVSMERVGREAGVSKALVYAYFQSRTALLQDLLLREHRRLKEQHSVEARHALDFEDLIRRTTRSYLEHVEQRGVLIQRLMNEPSVAVAVEELDRADREYVVDFLARRMADAYGLPAKVAAAATEIAMGMTGAAGEYVNRGKGDRNTVETLTLCMLLGGVAALRDRFVNGAAPARVKAAPKKGPPPRRAPA